MSGALLELKDLRVHFPAGRGASVKAVDGVSIAVRPRETLGLVGESGCGKSTLGRAVVGLERPVSGTIRFGERVIDWRRERKNLALKRRMQFVFQDPSASLNPRKTIARILALPFITHRVLSGIRLRRRLIELVEIVGLNEHYLDRYPHELSGGQKQRIGIARALALNPELIICDESVSALDVSIQAQILNLLRDLQENFHLTYLFISHDLSVVHYLSDRIAVMYLGRIVEIAESDELCRRPAHPYTRALFSALPLVDEQRERIVLSGDPPNPVNPPSGCPFHTRCPQAFERCRNEPPKTFHRGGGHLVACHLYE